MTTSITFNFEGPAENNKVLWILLGITACLKKIVIFLIQADLQWTAESAYFLMHTELFQSPEKVY